MVGSKGVCEHGVLNIGPRNDIGPVADLKKVTITPTPAVNAYHVGEMSTSAEVKSALEGLFNGNILPMHIQPCLVQKLR